MNNILTQLGQLGVIPVVVLEDAAHAQSLGRALLDGGLPCAEITLRLPMVHACGGSWLAEKTLIANGEFQCGSQRVGGVPI